MYARLNDLRADQRSPIWWVRRFGFLCVIGACAMLIASPLPFVSKFDGFDEFARLLFVWGVFWTFFTSPYQKPWWELILGEHRKESAGKPVRARLADEFKALRRGFSRTPIDERRRGPDDRRVSRSSRGDAR
jgi:hypothetical protein